MYEAERGKATRRVQFDGRVEGEERSFVAKDAPLDDGQVRMVRAGTVEAEPDASTADAAIAGSGIRISLFCWGVLRCASESKVWEMKRSRNENARFYEDRELVNL
jgi:hypothetical protein